MTSTWDEVQRLITELGKLKDPELYRYGLKYISNLIGEIHEYDHRHGEPITGAIYFSKPMEDIRKLLRGQKP